MTERDPYQRKLFQGKKYIKYFLEDDKLEKIEYLKNVKSNLILNLKDMKESEKMDVLKIIGKYELLIMDLEIENQNYYEVYDALYSAIHAYKRAGNYETIINIALKSLLTRQFDKDVKDKMFILIKDPNFKFESIPSFDYLKHILYEYVEHNLPFYKQNINKVPLYILQNLKFDDTRLQTLNTYAISVHPFYSKQITSQIKTLENYNAIKIIDNKICPKENYNLIKNPARAYENAMKIEKKSILVKIHKLIFEFSKWNTQKIKKWEKNTGLLNYFSTGEEIS